ncbi:hypothetical protein [Streptomyces malaysiensis]|uniref:hypothetical protein n=1 Tax=Streptomyces malaysiensis TaxID=92644 RepID=UPI0034268C55
MAVIPSWPTCMAAESFDCFRAHLEAVLRLLLPGVPGLDASELEGVVKVDSRLYGIRVKSDDARSRAGVKDALGERAGSASSVEHGGLLTRHGAEAVKDRRESFLATRQEPGLLLFPARGKAGCPRGTQWLA